MRRTSLVCLCVRVCLKWDGGGKANEYENTTRHNTTRYMGQAAMREGMDEKYGGGAGRVIS